VALAPVLGDAAYGDSFAFRQRLRDLNLEFFLQVTGQDRDRVRLEACAGCMACFELAIEDEGGEGSFLFKTNLMTNKIQVANN
jgi:hypothetical protein